MCPTTTPSLVTGVSRRPTMIVKYLASLSDMLTTYQLYCYFVSCYELHAMLLYDDLSAHFMTRVRD